MDTSWPDAARELSTAEISDALDFFRLPGSALGIGRVAGPARIFGPAFTVRFAPINMDTPGTVGDYLDDIPAGAVAVLDNGGRMDCTVWGGIMSQLAAHRGVGGTVVHCVCRDTDEAESAGYPLYARGRFMGTGKDRVQVDAVQEPVTLSDVRVVPGDILVGDVDGVVVVPALRARSVRAGVDHARGRESDTSDSTCGHAAERSAAAIWLSHMQRAPK